MKQEPRQIWLPLAILGVALVLWAGMLALGAFLQMGADQPHHDWRRALIVVGCMAGFLGVWGLALWKRSRRER
jgi:membrane protein DedA with SNARE-associated domain